MYFPKAQIVQDKTWSKEKYWRHEEEHKKREEERNQERPLRNVEARPHESMMEMLTM